MTEDRVIEDIKVVYGNVGGRPTTAKSPITEALEYIHLYDWQILGEPKLGKIHYEEFHSHIEWAVTLVKYRKVGNDG